MDLSHNEGLTDYILSLCNMISNYFTSIQNLNINTLHINLLPHIIVYKF